MTTSSSPKKRKTEKGDRRELASPHWTCVFYPKHTCLFPPCVLWRAWTLCYYRIVLWVSASQLDLPQDQNLISDTVIKNVIIIKLIYSHYHKPYRPNYMQTRQQWHTLNRIFYLNISFHGSVLSVSNDSQHKPMFILFVNKHIFNVFSLTLCDCVWMDLWRQ